jgi:hypothetical protein
LSKSESASTGFILVVSDQTLTAVGHQRSSGHTDVFRCFWSFEKYFVWHGATDQADFAYVISCSSQFLAGLSAGKDVAQ